MRVFVNNQPLPVLCPRYQGKRITIAIDSSKRNTGLTVGDENCNPIDVYDINGKEDGTGEMDVLALCQEQRKFLRTLLGGSKPLLVGIEDIITVNETSSVAGITQHMSRFKITAVFMSFISFFQDTFGITPELVNNQAWKSAVLPKEYTSRSIGKGSLAYFKAAKSKYAAYTDDATDSICILRYLKLVHGITDTIRIEFAEVKRFEYGMEILCKETRFAADTVVWFEYNEGLTVQQNATVMSNRLGEKAAGVAEIPIQILSVGEIHEMVRGTFPEYVERVLLVVRRQ